MIVRRMHGIIDEPASETATTISKWLFGGLAVLFVVGVLTTPDYPKRTR